MSDLRTYLREKLTADGYGGLAGEWCGCEYDDLAPCEGPDLARCIPGYVHRCVECPRTPDDCPICPIEDGWSGGLCVTDSRDWPEPGRDDG